MSSQDPKPQESIEAAMGRISNGLQPIDQHFMWAETSAAAIRQDSVDQLNAFEFNLRVESLISTARIDEVEISYETLLQFFELTGVIKKSNDKFIIPNSLVGMLREIFSMNFDSEDSYNQLINIIYKYLGAKDSIFVKYQKKGAEIIHAREQTILKALEDKKIQEILNQREDLSLYRSAEVFTSIFAYLYDLTEPNIILHLGLELEKKKYRHHREFEELLTKLVSKFDLTVNVEASLSDLGNDIRFRNLIKVFMICDFLNEEFESEGLNSIIIQTFKLLESYFNSQKQRIGENNELLTKALEVEAKLEELRKLIG